MNIINFAAKFDVSDDVIDFIIYIIIICIKYLYGNIYQIYIIIIIIYLRKYKILINTDL